MGLLRSITGNVRIRITAASPADMLTSIHNAQISLRDIKHVDDLSVEAVVDRKSFPQLKKLLERRGEKVESLDRYGFYWSLKSLLHRPVLLCGMLLLIVLSLYLPGRILFVHVEGNRTVETSVVLDNAERSGIFFGASRRQIRSEKVKNVLLASIPELQWAGVNTYGCVAVISVRERSTADQTDSEEGVCSIVAARDGVILQATVLQGNPLCKVGQAVKEGQVLVSGYTDYGTLIKTTRADAEIFAQTRRSVRAVTPVDRVWRGEKIKQITRYSILIGKKLINFSQDSGISDMTCAKMYSVRYLTLPGGFALPVALVTERLTYYQPETAASPDEESYDWLRSYSESYLQDAMIAGKILQSSAALDLQDGVCYLYGEYACSEMIGRVRNEEIIQKDGKNG